jgi:hypothetical protein
MPDGSRPSGAPPSAARDDLADAVKVGTVVAGDGQVPGPEGGLARHLGTLEDPDRDQAGVVAGVGGGVVEYAVGVG